MVLLLNQIKTRGMTPQPNQNTWYYSSTKSPKSVAQVKQFLSFVLVYINENVTHPW